MLVTRSRSYGVATAIKNLKDVSFDTVAVRGVSGMTLGSILAHVLKKNLCIIRKDDGSHSCRELESGRHFQGRYIIVDDLIDTGKTIKAIIKAIEDDEREAKSDLIRTPTYYPDYAWKKATIASKIALKNFSPSECVGIYLYETKRLMSMSIFNKIY